MAVEVINGGFLTTVQDRGRFGYQQNGVMVSGPMDERAFTIANLLAGNGREEAELEITLTGPELLFEEDCVIAVTGADMGALLDGRRLPLYQAVSVRAGSVLRFRGLRSGVRSYLAVAGGFRIPDVMGSKATLLRGNLGGYQGRKLQKGDRLELEAPVPRLPGMAKRRLEPESIPEGVRRVRVIPGPQEEAFTEEGVQTFYGAEYTVSFENDRMGYRLEGPVIRHRKDGNIITDGIATGSVQVPSGGLPIIMMADRQCTGGYTKIANVITADLPLVAQMKAGEKIRFVPVSVEEAQRLLREREKEYEALEERFMEASEGKETCYTIHINGKRYDVTVEEYSGEER